MREETYVVKPPQAMPIRKRNIMYISMLGEKEDAVEKMNMIIKNHKFVLKMSYNWKNA